ncbi:g7290 [Coccomyxa elongata]
MLYISALTLKWTEVAHKHVHQGFPAPLPGKVPTGRLIRPVKFSIQGGTAARLLQEACPALPIKTSGCGRDRSSAPSAAACAGPRSLCYRGSRRRLLQEAYAALPLAPAGASAIGARARSSAGALPVLQGKPPAPAKGGLRYLATRDQRVRPLQEQRTQQAAGLSCKALDWKEHRTSTAACAQPVLQGLRSFCLGC